MNGKELVLYVLNNNLEGEEIDFEVLKFACNKRDENPEEVAVIAETSEQSESQYYLSNHNLMLGDKEIVGFPFAWNIKKILYQDFGNIVFVEGSNDRNDALTFYYMVKEDAIFKCKVHDYQAYPTEVKETERYVYFKISYVCRNTLYIYDKVNKIVQRFLPPFYDGSASFPSAEAGDLLFLYAGERTPIGYPFAYNMASGNSFKLPTDCQLSLGCEIKERNIIFFGNSTYSFDYETFYKDYPDNQDKPLDIQGEKFCTKVTATDIKELVAKSKFVHAVELRDSITCFEFKENDANKFFTVTFKKYNDDRGWQDSINRNFMDSDK